MRDEAQDRADIAKVIAGDVGAFEGVVHRWQGRIVSLAWQFCRDRAEAEDMAQEVFIKVYRALPSFRGDSMFSTWVVSIAVNTFRSRLSARKITLPEQAVDERPGALDKMQERERAEAVRRAVLTLPQHYRESVVLFYFEEKDLAETARVLGVSEGTLKARLHRARDLLRQRCAGLAMEKA